MTSELHIKRLQQSLKNNGKESWNKKDQLKVKKVDFSLIWTFLHPNKHVWWTTIFHFADQNHFHVAIKCLWNWSYLQYIGLVCKKFCKVFLEVFLIVGISMRITHGISFLHSIWFPLMKLVLVRNCLPLS